MTRIVFDEPAWWQRPRWRITVGAAATTAAAVLWRIALTPADEQPIAPRVAAAPAAPAPRLAPPIAEAIVRPTPAAASAVAPPLPPTQPPLSTMVAPGVHVTPLSVPPGTEPVPAGPRAHDSEAEN
jgi:hypothetical protein